MLKGEEEATTRVILLAEFVGVPAGIHIVHVTSKRLVAVLSCSFLPFAFLFYF